MTKYFKVQFNISDQRFQARFGKVQTATRLVGGDIYTGSYEVVPKVEAQTLPTAHKVMTEDVKITKIPYYVTGNTSGGDTVYIAKEV